MVFQIRFLCVNFCFLEVIQFGISKFSKLKLVAHNMGVLSRHDAVIYLVSPPFCICWW